MSHLIEREDQLALLQDVVSAPVDRGRTVLLSGEAGNGKTSLVNAWVKRLDHRFRVLVATCEPLGIPAAFAPLYEIADQLPEDLRDAVSSGSGRQSVNLGMLDVLKNDRTVLVLEDMHWSDEATLGLVRFLGRRIGATNSCLMVTYRSEELDLNPPLRLVVADLGPAAVRIELPTLTRAGVEQMASGLDIDPDAVYRATLGNPFFVEQLLRHPDLSLPPTVQNAVLASAEQMPADALELLYTTALSPEGIDLALAESLHPHAGRFLDLALQRRLVEISNDRVTCRHELIRESLARAIPESMSRRLHRSLLAFLEEKGGDSADIARRAYHSIGAGDAEKALSYSLQAAADAARAGAHRQAAYHFDNALQHSSSMTRESLSATLLEAAHEHCFINAFERACELAKIRLPLAGDASDQARARAWLSFFESRKNNLGTSRQEAQLAIDVLRGEPPCEELALALGVASWVELVEGNWDAAKGLGDEGRAHAQALGSLGIEVYAATTAATARSLLDEEDGVVLLEEAARRGVDGRVGEFAARALNNRGAIALSRGRLEEARLWFDQMIEYSTANELDAWYIAGFVTRAHINVLSGHWDAADRDLEVALGQRTCIQTEVEALVTAATLRARRGDPGSRELIKTTLARIEGSTDQDALVMGCALALQGAWIGSLSSTEAAVRYDELLSLPILGRDSSARGLISFWARRLDLEPVPGEISGPAGLEGRGFAAAASEVWEHLGFPVEAAIARAMVPDPNLDSVFADLRRLGAEGVMRGLRRELERRGVKQIPRGERHTTRENPAGLTTREAEVLVQIAAGLSNAAIAKELFISEKTASHHVSAVLAKLGVTSRLQAATLAIANGWSGTDPRPT